MSKGVTMQGERAGDLQSRQINKSPATDKQKALGFKTHVAFSDLRPQATTQRKLLDATRRSSLTLQLQAFFWCISYTRGES